MRIVNVIVTKNDGTILNADSFAIYEEQLSNDIVSEAENLFIDTCVDYKFASETNTTKDDLNERNLYREDVAEELDDGYRNLEDVVVSIVWTEV